MAVNLEPTAEMLDEDLYWDIVARSLENSSDEEEQEEFLIDEIGKLTPKEMVGFRLRTDCCTKAILPKCGALATS